MRAELLQDIGRLLTPADPKKEITDASCFGGLKIILQIQTEDDGLANVRQSIGDNGLAAFEFSIWIQLMPALMPRLF